MALSTHMRSQVMDQVKARLIAIPDFAAPFKVERGRAAAIPQELLPALTPTWGEASESSERRPFSGPAGEDGYDRRLPLSIIVHLREGDPESEFDRICCLVEMAMEADVTLGGVAVDLSLQSTRLFVNQQTGVPLGVGSLAYSIWFKTLAADPGVAAI